MDPAIDAQTSGGAEGDVGLAFGELWQLHDLAAACAADERHELLVAAAPTDARGAVGSSANALAIR